MRDKRLFIPVIAGGFKLPYSVDFSLGSMGRLVGSTWSIVGGKAVNTPTLSGTELLTDPGLEGTYTSGQNAAIFDSSTPTYEQSADVHGGSKAQQVIMDAALKGVYWVAPAGVAGQWVQFSVWTKRTAGASAYAVTRLFATGGLPGSSIYSLISEAAYTQKKMSMILTGTATPLCHGLYLITGTDYDTIIFDDGSLQTINLATLTSLVDSKKTNVTVKALPDTAQVDSTQHGLVLRADAASSPTNAIFITFQQHSYTATSRIISAIKKVGNTYSSILAETTKTFDANSLLEARVTDTTLSVWYGGVQVGTNITVSDAELQSGTYCGLFSAGGNTLKSFFVGAG